MTHREILSQTKPPWIVQDVITDERSNYDPILLYSKNDNSITTIKLRGSKMRTKSALMNEFGAALQFFDGFGENWYGLGDCLSLMDEWRRLKELDRLVLVITDSTLTLSREEPSELHWFVKVLEETGEWWSKAIIDNGPYNRDPMPFHVVLQRAAGETEAFESIFGDIPVLR